MKSQRPQKPLSAAGKSPPLSPPMPPQTLLKPLTSKTHAAAAAPQISSRKLKKSRLKPTIATASTTGRKATISTTNWTPLNLIQSELSLPLTFPTGQTFRWKQTGPLQYTGTLGPHLVSLKHHHQNSAFAIRSGCHTQARKRMEHITSESGHVHVFGGGRIATRLLLPELAGARLTPKLCGQVADAFVSKYRKYAGWAQTLLFIAELPSQKSLLPSHLWTVEENQSANKKDSEADTDS